MRTLIEIKCVDCGIEAKVDSGNYKRSIKNYGNYKCRRCRLIETAGGQRLNYDFVKSEFEKRGYILLDTEYKNAQTPLRYLCSEHGEQTIKYNNLRQGKGCRRCAELRTGKHNSGENSNWWRGGTSDILRHGRNIISPWKTDSFKNANWKCDITGDGGYLNIHHLYSFNKIIREVFDNTKLPIHTNVNDYTDKEISVINDEILRLHYYYGLGVCLKEDIHKLFHSEYGCIDNTPDQYYEFKERYLKGEFDGRITETS